MLEISEWQITSMLSVLLMLIIITATFSYIEWKRNNKYNEYNKYTDDLISKAKEEFDAIKKRNEKELKRLSDILHRHTKGD